MKKSIKSIVAMAAMVVAGNAVAAATQLNFINKSSYSMAVQELNGSKPSNFTIPSKKTYTLTTSSTQFKVVSKPTTAYIDISSGNVKFGKYDKQGNKPTSISTAAGSPALSTPKVIIIDVGYRSPADGVEATAGNASTLNSYQ